MKQKITYYLPVAVAVLMFISFIIIFFISEKKASKDTGGSPTIEEQTFRYRDNNGYESEMTISNDGIRMRDNNGYESEMTVDDDNMELVDYADWVE